MKAETDPVTDEEFVFRFIWGDFYKPALACPVRPRAFEPKQRETTGISVFRTTFVTSPADTLAVIAEDKRDRYSIARWAVRDLTALGLTVLPDPRTDEPRVPGHAVIRELTFDAFQADKARWQPVIDQLAALAAADIVHRPSPTG